MKAIKSTRQVTKAMELVSASKMRRAVLNAQTLREYALMAWRILRRLTANESSHPFMEQRPTGKVLAILFTSDRGLCGSLNAQVLRAVATYTRSVKELKTFDSLEFIAIGRKGQQFLKRSGLNVVAAFPALSNHPTFKDVLPITRMAMDGYKAGTYDHVVLIYADFVSALLQEPVVKVLLPFSSTELRGMIESLLPVSRNAKMDDTPASNAEYLFEPSAEEVLSTVLPQLTEMQVYQAVLEACASEHSARMVAMRNATDNASDILDDLTLTYNRTRQANITGELAELSAAAAAMG